jgi:UDP-GlcNAc:undecaprenyl-phosphate GlcNAc-1-phosphate transferase
VPDLGDYLLVGLVAFAVTLLTTPLVRRMAERLGWVVQPDERRVHTVPTPDVGGIALFLGFLAAMAVAWQLDAFDSLLSTNSEPIGVVLAALVIFVVVLADDLWDLPGPAKVTGLVVSGLILTWFGVVMFYFRIPFLDVVAIGGDFAPLVTVLWVVGMANAVNLIDGLDGLAAGIVAIASGAFFLYAQRLIDLELLLQPNIGPLIAVVVCGMCLGFLPFNFNPARIFMGDSGALLLGTLMAASTIVVGGRADPTNGFTGQTYFFFAPLAVPLVILGVPILDTAWAIIRRATRGQGVATADKNHLHHRLMRLGHGQRRSVVILWLWTAILSAFVLYPAYNDGQGDAIVPLGVAALVLVLYTVLHPEVRRLREDAG